MNPEQARHLVTETFTQSFDRARFLRFTQNILNRLDTKDDRQKVYRGAYVTQAFADKVNYYERLGSYTDSAADRVDVLAVYLNRGTTLERGRTSLRNFAAHYLLKHDKASAVLVAFVSPDESDWRFSFVKLEYSLEQTDEGRVSTKKELTPARRYSFLIGKNEHSHTAQKQFLPLLENDRTGPLLAGIEKAFDIERVTKEFFAQYKSLFEQVRDAVAALLGKDKALREDFAGKGIETDDFAKKLLGQIVFLYFLQKKGWFGVARGAAWGSGDKNYLRHLFKEREKYYVKAGSAGILPASVLQHANDVHQSSASDETGGEFSRLRAHGRRDACAPSAGNFFNDILEPLFYNTLATERTDDYSDRFGCKIPFLNGGLFEPFLGYDWVNTDILIPDALFSNNELAGEGERGTGILDVFDRYNFTVNEAEPLEKDVAVDPEMLGKVFENLLPENLRHKGGAYYTPRVIVNYMCQQSLINYLSTHLPEVERADIETFIRIGDFQADYEAAGTKSQKNNFLPASISRNARAIDKLLEEITVCDPAIGSGAFPVGMMQEIVRARLALSSVQGMPERSAYNLKRHAIQSSLYGVDIDPGAVEIAKLRLWLSLVVDETSRETIHALPNLDYKIMQGNSLLDEYAGVKLLDEELLARAFVDIEAQIDALNKKINEREREFVRVGAKEGRRSAAAVKIEGEINELKKQRERLYCQTEAPATEQATFQDLHSTAREKLAELKRLHKDFFDVSSTKRKRELRGRLEQVEWEFMEATLEERGESEALRELAKHRRDNRKNYFLWKLHFVEVFQGTGGFDVVIGNPPYVRQEEIKELKPALQRSFQSFTGTADLYVYFYECGVRSLNGKGTLAFITSNKYFRAGYGAKLRGLLSGQTTIRQLIDFGDAPVFEAIAYPTILITSKTPPTNGNNVRALTWKMGAPVEQFVSVVEKDSFALAQNELTADSWRLEAADVLRLLDKLRSKGKPLGEYVNGKFYYGIKTGLNEAFVVDRATRDALIKEHPSSKEILKPFLRGRDVKRWGVNYADLYLIKIESSENKRHAWTGKQDKEAEKIFAATYPAIHARFQNFRKGLIERGDKGNYFWELRSCAYWDEFAKPKIAYPNICKRNEFAWDDRNFYTNQKAFIIPNATKYLLGILNTSVVMYLFTKLIARLQNGFYEPSAIFVKDFPIANATPKQQAPIVELVDRILAAKRDDPQADVSRWEREIDRLVYQLYELTDEEIAIIEKTR
ncbi:MAG: Eco57I restriction-modification methylase domain-containing protein [Pyrinomonadaceae bacterium]